MEPTTEQAMTYEKKRNYIILAISTVVSVMGIIGLSVGGYFAFRNVA
jgi:hypothetical protein